MDDFKLDVSDVDCEDGAKTIAQVFIESFIDNEKGVMRKEFVQQFFNSCLINLENQTISPKIKFYTIFILRELSYKDKQTLKIFSTFSNHPLYNYLEEIAHKVDPKKAISEKGKTLFPGAKQMGNSFIRIILQSLVNWGQRFPNNSKKEATKFKKVLNRLIQEKVVLPKQFIYYQKVDRNSKQSTPAGSKKQQISKNTISNDNISNATSVPKIKPSKQKYTSQIKFIFSRIQTMVSLFQDSDEMTGELQKQILDHHKKLELDYNKLQAGQHQMIDGQTEEIVQLYFHLTDFLKEEKKFYKIHVDSNDFQSYISEFKIAYERIFNLSQIKKQPKIGKKPDLKNQISIDKKLSEQKVKNKAVPEDIIQQIVQEETKIKKREQNQKKYSQKQNSQYQTKIDPVNTKVLDIFFSKLGSYSKTMNTGFSLIAKSLDKQKKSTIAPRKKPPTASNFSKSSKFGVSSSLTNKSQPKLKGIFADPPNPNLKPKTYSGDLVIQNNQLQKMSNEINKQQGARRFKISNFKDQYVLYDDDNLQIGYKCSQIYEKVDKFSAMINFELYFGNKSQKALQKFIVSFQGDKQSLIYTNPQTIQSTINPSSQVKLQLLNIPKSIPYGLIKMHISYQLDRSYQITSAVLPNSILKMVTYYKIIPEKVKDIWGQCVKILKSQPFKLSSFIPPNNLRIYIKQLEQRQSNSYAQFSKQGSTTDYELFCEVVLQQSYQGCLKINIRPDLSVVLQCGLYQNEQNCLRNFRFYMQSLEMVLKENEA